MSKRKEIEHLHTLAQELESTLHAIRRKMRQRLEADYARSEVTAPQRLVIEALANSDGMGLKQLSAKVSLAHSTVSGIVDRLEKKGLVQRRVLKTDHRVTQITVSKAVRQYLEKRAPELKLHPLLRALRRASEAERITIRKGIETLDRQLAD